MYDRSKCVGASDAVYIQAGDWATLFDRKQPESPREYSLAARLGHELEGFNRELFEEDTGKRVEHLRDWEVDPMRLDDYEWCTYLPDGLIEDERDDSIFNYTIPFEAKAINMMWKPLNLLAKYMPQLQHAMRVMHAPYCYFSVIYLNTKYEWTKVPYDPPYDAALFEQEKLFHFMLERDIRPPEYKGKREGWI